MEAVCEIFPLFKFFSYIEKKMESKKEREREGKQEQKRVYGCVYPPNLLWNKKFSSLLGRKVA